MSDDAIEKLCDWGTQLEKALGIPIIHQTGALLLKTKSGYQFGITIIPRHRALLFTGMLGMASSTLSPNMLRALLALNLDIHHSGGCMIGIEPSSQQILLRLIWAPLEEHWKEQAFATTLAAFSEHIDALANAIKNEELLRLLDPPLHPVPHNNTAPLWG
jgi:hypothetical protein